MNYLKSKDWELSENFVTDEKLFNKRREFLKLGAALAASSVSVMDLPAKEFVPTPNLEFLKDLNLEKFRLNTYDQISSYNNFYEFSTNKKAVKPLAKNFKTDPWKIKVDGLVEKPFEIDMHKVM